MSRMVTFISDSARLFYLGALTQAFKTPELVTQRGSGDTSDESWVIYKHGAN